MIHFLTNEKIIIYKLSQTSFFSFYMGKKCDNFSHIYTTIIFPKIYKKGKEKNFHLFFFPLIYEHFFFPIIYIEFLPNKQIYFSNYPQLFFQYIDTPPKKSKQIKSNPKQLTLTYIYIHKHIFITHLFFIYNYLFHFYFLIFSFSFYLLVHIQYLPPSSSSLVLFHNGIRSCQPYLQHREAFSPPQVR